MEEKSLSYYLTHPSEAQNIPESQIRDWLEKYPYSPGVRWLKARKDLVLQGAEVEKSITAAARHATSLRFLKYKLLQDPEAERKLWIDLRKEKIESESSKITLERKVVSSPVVKKAVKPTVLPIKQEEVKQPKETPKPIEEEPKKTAKGDDKPQKAASAPKPKAQPTKKSAVVPPKLVAKPQEKKKVTPKAKPPEIKISKAQKERAQIVDKVLKKESLRKMSFSQWLLSLEGREELITKNKEPKSGKKKSKKKSKKKKKNRLHKLIDQSIAEKDDAISETYADLIAVQGYTDKAIEIYGKLQLKFPEKSSYFAAKIKELENL